MTTEIVKWEDELKRQASEQAAAETVQSSSLSIKAGVLMYRSMPVAGNKLDVVVLGAVREHQYFPERYDPNNIQPPLCWAIGMEEGTMGPDAQLVTEAQSDNCADCKMFEWGSDPNGGRGKACKEKRRLAFISATALQDDILGAEIATLTIPVMSVANWSGYVNKIAAALGRPAWAVVTTISVVPDPKSQFKVKFDYVLSVNEDYLNDLHKKVTEAEPVLHSGYPKRQAQAEPEQTGKKRKY